MEQSGFQFYFAYPAFTDERTGQTLQWDGMFVRKSLIPGLSRTAASTTNATS
jgi:hypothetical protein